MPRRILTANYATVIPETVVLKCFEDSEPRLTPRHVVMLLYILLHAFSIVSGIRDVNGDVIYAIAGTRCERVVFPVPLPRQQIT